MIIKGRDHTGLQEPEADLDGHHVRPLLRESVGEEGAVLTEPFRPNESRPFLGQEIGIEKHTRLPIYAVLNVHDAEKEGTPIGASNRHEARELNSRDQRDAREML